MFPLFQDASIFTVLPVLYADGVMDAAVHPTAANPVPGGVIACLSLLINVVALALNDSRAREQGKNPYKHEIFVGTRDYEEAMARAE